MSAEHIHYPQDWSSARDRDGAIWVFGYGSLMWRPGFPYQDSMPAILVDYARSFCLWSESHRGKPGHRGLVLGLDAQAGTACEGMAFRIADEDWIDTAAYLEERELIGYPYDPAHLTVSLRDGREVRAHCFVARHTHPHYAGPLPLETAAQVILTASGEMGLNRDYLINTVEALESHGYHDPGLHALLLRVRALTADLDAGAGI